MSCDSKILEDLLLQVKAISRASRCKVEVEPETKVDNFEIFSILWPVWKYSLLHTTSIIHSQRPRWSTWTSSLSSSLSSHTSYSQAYETKIILRGSSDSIESARNMIMEKVKYTRNNIDAS